MNLRWVFAFCLLSFALPASAATVPAKSCSYDDVQSAVNRAVDNDVVQIPAGTCTWTSMLAISRAITLQGAGVGLTIIKDGVNSGSLLYWRCVPNGTHRLTGIDFKDGGRTNQLFGPIIEIQCYSSGSTTMRVDHNKFDHLNGFHIRPHDVIGVIDHNIFLTMPTRIPIYAFHASWAGVGNHGDNSWTTDVRWGSSEFLFVEDNTIAYDQGISYACWDNLRGFRGVARFNTIIGCEFETHGTETGGRDRGTRAIEVYKNNMNLNGQPARQIADIRSGAALIWGNTLDNRAAGYGSANAATLVNDRTTFSSMPWGAADGRSVWDINDAQNPFLTETATSGGTKFVTVAGAGWSPDRWKGYMVRKTSPCSGNCSSIVWSNTLDTLTLADSENHGPNLTFSAGETFEINGLTETLDQPGRGGGSMLHPVDVLNCSHAGNIASCTAKAPHGLTNGQMIEVDGTWCDNCSDHTIYNGTFMAQLIDATQFTYTLPAIPESDPKCCIGEVTGVPSGWNDQTDFPVYTWLNTADGALINVAVHPTCNTCRENEHYYSYTTSFNGSYGMGAGPAANRPRSCTAGVTYWATDEGEWNSNQPGPDGQAYKCTAANTWSLYYTPYRYPHPLVTPGNPPGSVSVGADLSAVKVYPNPWRSDQHTATGGITFGGTVGSATLKIFTLSGHEVKKLDANGNVTWNLDNASGDKVASGIYVYLIKTPEGQTKRGKLAVIK